MIIHTYILCHNEEEVLPYTLKHYGEFSDKITIWDNYSDDKSIEIINSFPNTEVVPFDSGGEFRDDIHLNIKQNWWIEKSRGVADWVIAVDCDEFICSLEKDKTVRDVLLENKNKNITIPKIKGYDMLWHGEGAPNLNLPLFSQVTKGIPNWFMDKRAVFNPEISPCYLLPGCHPGDGRNDCSVSFLDSCPVTPEEEYCIFSQEKATCSKEPALSLKHFRYVNESHFIKKDTARKERLGEFSRARSFASHYYPPLEDRKRDYFDFLNKFSSHIIDFEF